MTREGVYIVIGEVACMADDAQTRVFLHEVARIIAAELEGKALEDLRDLRRSINIKNLGTKKPA